MPKNPRRAFSFDHLEDKTLLAAPATIPGGDILPAVGVPIAQYPTLTDVQALQADAAADNLEIFLAQTQLVLGSRADVMDYASMIVADHRDTSFTLRELAQARHVTLPNNIAPRDLPVALSVLDAWQGSAPGASARKELHEELGIEATDWTDLGVVDLDTSMVHCPVTLYLARGLTFGETEREGTESMQTLKMTFEEAAAMVMDGRITHAASSVLILKASRLRG